MRDPVACSIDREAMFDSQTDVAAIVYEPEDDPDSLISTFASDLQRSGNRVVGLLQLSSRAVATSGDMPVVALPVGNVSHIKHRRAEDASGCCSLNGEQVSRIQQDLAKAIDVGADLVIINRFGKMEMSGRGLLAEICMAVSVEVPVLVAVPERRFEAWNRFCGGMGVRLRCSRQQLDHWWSAIGRMPACREQKKPADFCAWAK